MLQWLQVQQSLATDYGSSKYTVDTNEPIWFGMSRNDATPTNHKHQPDAESIGDHSSNGMNPMQLEDVHCKHANGVVRLRTV
jgi:hypothetical protein